MTRTFIRALMVIVTLTPSLAFAGAGDVTLTTSAVISVQSLSINISGSSASIQSMVVGASSFDVVLLATSTITIASADRRNFDISPTSGGFTKTLTCDSSNSKVTLTGGTNGTRTITITPLSS